MKVAIAWVAALIVGSGLHFFIFLMAYQKFTFPYLPEEQRMENAPFIFLYVLPAIVLASAITTLVFHFLSRQKIRYKPTFTQSAP